MILKKPDWAKRIVVKHEGSTKGISYGPAWFSDADVDWDPEAMMEPLEKNEYGRATWFTVSHIYEIAADLKLQVEEC